LLERTIIGFFGHLTALVWR